MGLILRGGRGPWYALIIGLMLSAHTIAVAADSDAPAEPVLVETLSAGETSSLKSFADQLAMEFSLSAGLRSDCLDWSIAGTSSGGPPDVLSELSWSDVDSYQLELANRTHYKKHIYFRGAVQYAWIRNGTVRDSDFGQDSRMAEWSRSISETNDDEVWDASLGGGYAFFFMQDRLSVAPLVGYSYHKQNLRITNGMQVISLDNPFSMDPDDNPPAIGPLSSALNSTYRARWRGPWLGLDLRYRPKNRALRWPPLQLGLSVEYHWADYYGEGNWNLRSDLDHPKSFEHEADGTGISITGECLIKLTPHWDLSAHLNFQDWSTSSGTDRKFLNGGGSIKTRLNEVNWESKSFMVGAVYRF